MNIVEVDEKRKPLLLQGIFELRRIDRFQKADANLGRQLAGMPWERWTPRLQAAAHGILLRHKHLLSFDPQQIQAVKPHEIARRDQNRRQERAWRRVDGKPSEGESSRPTNLITLARRLSK